MSLPSSISAISDLCFRAISGSSSASLSIDKIASIRFEVLSLQQDVAFVQALKDIPSQSVLNALNSLSTNLTKLFETSNATIAQPTFTQQTLPTALELLRRCRRDVGSVGKEWITSSEPSTQVNVILKVTENTDPHTENILEAFMRMPFGLCPADVASVQWSRDLWPRWAGVMERTGEQWAEKMLEIGGSSQLQSSQYRLLGKLWGNLTHATLPLTYGWAPGDTQLGRFEAFLDQLDQGLRDSLFRQMSAHSMVFVSSENSGKSTLINAILGKKLLPTGSGLVTAIPCRIIHSIGLEKPKLTIDGDYWSNRLTDLRASLVLPRDEIEKQLKLHYVRNEVRDFLSSIVDGSVTLDPTVMGDEAILLTLKRLNYLAQLLNIFTFRYDSFISHSWVSIHTSFPGLSENIGWTEYEIVDIPGVPNDESKFHWDELTIKSLQRATSIVAVVPTTGIASGYWTRLPNYIRKGTHLPVSAVVITQTDVVPDPKSSEEEQEEWKRIRAEIQRRFWPDAKEDKFASGQILECSVLVGQQLEVLASILSDHKEKSPTFEEFWSPRAPMALQYHYGDEEDWEERFQKGRASLDRLEKRLKRGIEKTNLRITLASLYSLLDGSQRPLVLLQELKGVKKRISRLMGTLEPHAQELGLAPYNTQLDETEIKRLEYISTDLMAKWSDSEDAKSRADMMEKLDALLHTEIESACKQVTQPETTADAVSLCLDFNSMEEVDHFVDAMQKNLRSTLLDIHAGALNISRKNTQESLKARIEEAATLIVDLDPQSEVILSALPSQSKLLEEFGSPPEPLVDTKPYIITKPLPQRRTNEFRSTKERVLKRFTTNKPEDLSLLGRALLAAISFVPYALKFPFVERRTPTSHQVQYRLDLGGLRTAYIETIARPWADQLSREIQKRLQEDEQLATDILTSAINSGIGAARHNAQSKLSKPIATNGSTPHVLNAVASECFNLLAAESALSTLIKKWEKKIQEPATITT